MGANLVVTASRSALPNRIDRVHVLETIDGIFSDEMSVVFVEGDSGCGATTLLEQFKDYKRSHCFGLFIKAASRFAYSLDFLRLSLAEQFAEYLGRDLSSTSAVDEADFASLRLAVRKKSGGAPLYFVVDGLQQIHDSERSSIEEIFKEIFPIGPSCFRFLVTGTQEKFAPLLGPVKSKTYTVQRLSKTESLQLLDGVAISDAKKNELIVLCKGLPGRLISVRGIVGNDADADNLLGAKLLDYPDFILLEMKPLNGLSDTQRLIVALIVYSKFALSATQLQMLSGGTVDDLKAIASSCGFLSISDDAPFSEFISETYRRYAEKMVESLRAKSISIQIEHLAANPTSQDAVQFLPAYYQSINQQQAILDMLDHEHYAQLLKATGSFSSLQMRAAMGARSAAELNEAVSIFQFSLQRSLFANIASSRGFKSQVGALVALGRRDEALNLATQAPTVELRLRMMAEYARYLTENGIVVETSIRDAIRESSSEIAGGLADEDIEQLAQNVAHFDIDLAIELLDRIQDSRVKEGRDEALVKLTIASAGSSGVRSEVADRMSQKVSNDRHRALIAFIANCDGGPSLNDISAISANLDVEKRIFFLRCILSGPKINVGAMDLVRYALDQLVSSAGYLPKVRDLADFATPLSYCAGDGSEMAALIGRFEAQLGLAEKSSASVPLIDLKMKLAIAESSFDLDRSHERLIDAYVEVGGIFLPDARAECLALVLRALKRIDRDGRIEKKDSLSVVLSEDLLATLNELFCKTASHFMVARSALGVISSYDSAAALNLAASLNTVVCRDEAYETIALHLVVAGTGGNSVAHLKAAVGRISERWRRQNALVTIIEACLRGAYRLQWAPTLCDLMLEMAPSARVAEGLILLMEIYTASQQRVPESIIFKLSEVEGQISSGALRCEVLYQAAALLAKDSLAVAGDFYKRAEVVRSEFYFISGVGVETVRICLSLLLRAARPMISHGLFDSSYLARFVLLCDAIPDPCGRVAHLVDLALKAACEGKLELSVEIFNKHCVTILESDLSVDDQLYVGTLLFGPAFMTRGAIALKYLAGLDTVARDQAILSLCLTLISGVTEADARPTDMSRATIDYNTAENVISLLEHVETDSIIAVIVRSLATASLTKGSKSKVAGHQRAGMKAEIIRIAREKLPQTGSVSHNGYRIEVEAFACRLSDTPTDVWQRLCDEARDIPNLADRVLVKSEIARVLPAKLTGLAKKMLQECRADIAEIPSAYDRLGRMESLIEAARSVDASISRAAIRDSLSISFEIEDAAVAERSRRKLLDLAEQFDPKGLDDLVNTIDDDPARAIAKSELKQQVKIQKFRRKIADGRGGLGESDLGGNMLPNAAHKNLVSLVGGRAEPLMPDLLTRYVTACGEWDLVRAFPVLSWYLETLARRVRRSEDALAKCAPPWEVLLLSSELAIKFLSSSGSRDTKFFVDAANSPASGVLVKRGDGGDEGQNFIRNWLRKGGVSAERIIVSDPYFKPSDIDFVRMVLAEVPAARVVIVTSKAELMRSDDGAFNLAWANSMDQDPPEVEIVGISDFESSKAPIHDRWIIWGDRGLRMGTSFGGLGARWSEVSELDMGLVSEVGLLVSSYADKKREVAGRKVSYYTIAL